MDDLEDNLTVPFTYLVTAPNGQRYYGCRYARGCHPLQLGTVYFTSSKLIRGLAEESPADYVFQVRQAFIGDSTNLQDRIQQCKQWENKVLRRLGAVHSPNWLNQSEGVSPEFVYKGCSAETRARLALVQKDRHPSLETRSKLSAARRTRVTKDETRQKMSVAQTGRHHSEWTKQKISEAQLGIKNHMYGKHPKGTPHTEVTKQLLSEQHKGMRHTADTKARMSKAHTGKRFSASHRAKLADAARQRWADHRMKQDNT